ncbi:MAG: hypothetical protein AAGU21_13015 [Solidesulfovibrio sp.]|jgi:hypothetical protein|uniref:hypothetical protein n=1 Tax=Solidesulfovibrio sp. TaxID=2910990 RepID=UPI002B1F1155|nr:hypothetical protein [Solidesulfovibrio sp.]MEA4856332.1 hypothetical protein [Solidesulfovibrio sp.]
MLFDRSASPAPELNGRQRLAVIGMDVAVLAEVVVSVYMASHSSEDFTSVFLKVFFAMCIPTVAAGIVAIRRFRDRHPATSATEAGA